MPTPQRQRNNPSLSTRRNLWKSKTEENKYARDARRFIAEYGAALQRALELCTRMGEGGKPVVDLAAFQELMQRTADRMLAGDGTAITQEHAKAGLTLGIQYAERSLEEAGVNDAGL